MISHVEPLPVNEFEVIRTIWLQGPEYQKFSGTLTYSRVWQQGYDYRTGDLLDAAIEDGLKDSFLNISHHRSHEIIFKGQKAPILERLRGKEKRFVEVLFNPSVSSDELISMRDAGIRFTATQRTYVFALDIVHNPPSMIPDIDAIPTFFSCDIPHQQIDHLMKTIKPV